MSRKLYDKYGKGLKLIIEKKPFFIEYPNHKVSDIELVVTIKCIKHLIQFPNSSSFLKSFGISISLYSTLDSSPVDRF